VVTNSGGTGVELADLLADEGLEVPELSGPLQDELRALLPGYASARNPVDMTPTWRLFTTLYPATIELLARSGEIDVVVPVLLQRSASPEVAAAVRDAVARLRDDGVPVPVYVCWVAPRAADAHASLLQEAGVPCFPWPERTARAVGVAVRCGLQAGRPPGPAASPSPQPSPQPPPRPSPRPAVPVGPGLLAPDAARELLAAAGVPVIETVLCDSAAMAVSAAARLGYPVVAKVAHPALTHKSDVGGVRLGLFTADAVRSAAADLLALADGAAVLVQPQREGIELVIGGIRDPEFGPVIMTGFGGVLVEARRDVQLAIAPVDEAQAGALLRSLRGAAVFTGLRGRPPVDLAPVAAMIVAVGDLMAGHPEISELDLNPVLVGASASIAVDWRIMCG
jgi:acetyltransferase